MNAIEQALARIRLNTQCACYDNVSNIDFCRDQHGYTFSVAIANRMALSERQLYVLHLSHISIPFSVTTRVFDKNKRPYSPHIYDVYGTMDNAMMMLSYFYPLTILRFVIIIYNLFASSLF